MHDDGEVDVRGTYTAIAVAALTNVLTPELVKGVAEYAASCQTWHEGGFANPGLRPSARHGFCAIATLCILDACHFVDLDALDPGRAASDEHRGRPQGRGEQACRRVLQLLAGRHGAVIRPCETGATPTTSKHHKVSGGGPGFQAHQSPRRSLSRRSWDPIKLQRYILLCAQVFPDGGLRDAGQGPRLLPHVPARCRAYRRRSTRTARLPTSSRLVGRPFAAGRTRPSTAGRMPVSRMLHHFWGWATFNLYFCDSRRRRAVPSATPQRSVVFVCQGVALQSERSLSCGRRLSGARFASFSSSVLD